MKMKSREICAHCRAPLGGLNLKLFLYSDGSNAGPRVRWLCRQWSVAIGARNDKQFAHGSTGQQTVLPILCKMARKGIR